MIARLIAESFDSLDAPPVLVSQRRDADPLLRPARASVAPERGRHRCRDRASLAEPPVQFLVNIDVRLPGDMPPPERAELLAAERRRGRELVAAGAIVSIWRIPGGLRNVGVWEAADATALHELLASLPLFPWLAADVTALAEHPLSRPED